MLKTIRPEALADNPFKMIGKDWMLVTACTTKESEDGSIITGRPNTMTASWGGVGIMWNKPVATIYLRPSRYTKEIIDQSETFSLSVLPEKFRTALDYCGSHSGRDEDKFQKAKLDVEYMNNTPWIKQARVVLFCRKIYAQEIDPYGFADEKVCNQNYKKDDFHTMYIAEITKVLVESRDIKK
ncbi:MAG: flavin reductase family protein [Treponema sp.]|nr:flavin reductase family protein [Treponema sp.]